MISLILISGIIVAAILYMARFGVANVIGSGQAQTGRSAVSTLRTLHWAQGLFRQSTYVDADGNGVGEFGSVAQLAAVEPLPGGGSLPTPLLAMAGAQVVEGQLEVGGYCVRVDLPDSPYERERRFVAWAWPQAQPAGTKIYCVDQDEQLWEAAAGEHLGCDSGPAVAPCPPGPEWKRWKNKTSKRPVGAP